MAPTSDERRRIAERLREEGRVLAKLDEGSETASLTLDDVLGVSHDGTWEDQFDRLADLMDPTCHVIPGEEAVAELKDGTRLTGVPLSCGHVVFGVSAKDMPKFCCECGSRITSGGER